MTLCCGVNCVLKECSTCMWAKQSKKNCHHGRKDTALCHHGRKNLHFAIVGRKILHFPGSLHLFLQQHYFYIISFPCVLIIYWFTHTNTQNSLHPVQYFHHLHSPLHSNCWYTSLLLILLIMQDWSLRITMQSNHRHILVSTPRRCCVRSNVTLLACHLYFSFCHHLPMPV
jgi:hypothetical protein